MNNNSERIKWRITKQAHRDALLLGANFNTNTEYGLRETYIIIFLGKWSYVIGRYMGEGE